jgi:hypothetical protein
MMEDSIDPRRATGSLSPTSTLQEDLVTAGQRRVNLIWESTQGLIALFTTGAMIYCSVKSIESPNLVNAFFLIIGFYFSRTNHAAIGGVGSKPVGPYQGR